MTERLLAENCFNPNSRFPVYCHYDGQFEPQPAYILLDIRSGEVNADYDTTINSGLPVCVWNNLELRFFINPYTIASEIMDLINENMDNFQAILDGSEIVWGGNEYIGMFDEDAQKIIEKFNVENSLYNYVDVVFFDDIYFSDKLWLDDKTKTLKELATYIYELGNDSGYFTDELNSVEKIENEILEHWLYRLYSGDDIPKREAELLITDDRIEIRYEWLAKINEFAA